MSTRLSFTTRTLRRSLVGTLVVLAMVPLLYFSACSSGDDNGGGGSAPNNNTPTGAANQFAYVIAAGASEIQAYNMDGSGNLSAIGGPISTGVLPHHVDVDRAGRFVYVSNHDSAFVSGWRINQDGSLDPINPAGGSPVITGLPVGPHSSIIDRTGAFLYVIAGTADSTLTAYQIDTSTGSNRGMPTAIAGQNFTAGTHAHNVTISPNNLFLYVASEGTPGAANGEVHAYSRDTTTGMLTARNVITGLETCDAVVVSNDSRFLFVAYTNAVEVLSIDQSTGALTKITPVSTFSTNNAGGGTGPHSIALHPNGQTLYTANINGPSVSVFRVDTNSGALTELQSPPIQTGIDPNFVAVHPNGTVLFTADAGSDQLSRFAINADGTLVAPATVISNTGDGTNGIGITRF
jgi:6-phosphogluconolactonase (cycloisomerase 2 family)